MEIPFIDTYTRFGVVPTRQDIGDMGAHFRRRDALLRTLGVVPSFVAGKQIAEFGPGSGENSIYFASLRPAHYTLIDGTASSIASIERLRERHYPNVPSSIVQCDFSEYRSDDGFDMVICEGAIPGQKNPKEMLLAIGAHVRNGGMLILTCFDEVSILPEILRRVLARIELGERILSASHVPSLLRLFETDLKSLYGMSRRHEDWMLDQIVHQGITSSVLSIADACDVLDGRFSPQGTSPRFFSDWRWYKTLSEEEDGFSKALKLSYWTNLHNLLDCGHVLPPVPQEDNMKLLHAARDLYLLGASMEAGTEALDKELLAKSLVKVRDNAWHLHPQTRDHLDSVVSGLAESAPTALRAIAGWWGRGQQYISFVRRYCFHNDES